MNEDSKRQITSRDHLHPAGGGEESRREGEEKGGREEGAGENRREEEGSEGDVEACREEGEAGRAEGDETSRFAGADAEDAGGRAGVGPFTEKRIRNDGNGPSGPFLFWLFLRTRTIRLTEPGDGDKMKMNFNIMNGGRSNR